MDEAGWVGGTYLRDLLDYLCYQRTVQRTAAGRRRLRLYGCACCRLVWDLVPDGACRRAVEAAEAYADGRGTKAELECLLRAAAPALSTGPTAAHRAAVQAVFRAASPAAKSAAWAGVDVSSALHSGWVQDDGALCGLLRDVFGNPFRPVAPDPRWRTADAVGLARAAYEVRAFDRLPILADALQDAGCDDADVLNHCRGPGPHARGCWVVDLILSKDRSSNSM